ncbi:1225_t:CDS:2 [Gigaspora rosea]|nr:1225_t:CDS:2 [Gigaspora rosea]
MTKPTNKHKLNLASPFPKCENCKEINEDSPSEPIYEEDGKTYFTPGDGNKFEIREEIFEKILRIKLRSGYDFNKFMTDKRTNLSFQPPEFNPPLPTSHLHLPDLEETSEDLNDPQ